jgi:hypothetical protein
MASPEHIVAQRFQIDMSCGNASQDSAGKPPNEAKQASEQCSSESKPHPDDAKY